jgi:hypothetical protein
MAITFEDNKSMKRAIVDPSAYKTCTPVGEFNFIIVWPKGDGRIQAAKTGYDEEIKSSTQYSLLTQSHALGRMTKVKTKPWQLHKSFERIGVWQEFIPWQYIHWISHGNNVRRLSVFFCPLRENPARGHFKFKEGFENWEDDRNKK